MCANLEVWPTNEVLLYIKHMKIFNIYEKTKK